MHVSLIENILSLSASGLPMGIKLEYIVQTYLRGPYANVRFNGLQT